MLGGYLYQFLQGAYDEIKELIVTVQLYFLSVLLLICLKKSRMQTVTVCANGYNSSVVIKMTRFRVLNKAFVR